MGSHLTSKMQAALVEEGKQLEQDRILKLLETLNQAIYDHSIMDCIIAIKKEK